MNWAWAASLDNIWRSPTFPMWLTLAAAGFFALILLVTLLRAEKSVANVVLAVITLLAIGSAVTATLRGFGTVGQVASVQTHSTPPVRAGLPQLACIDDLAGDAVLIACEKVLFGSAESSAAAVAYAATMVTELVEAGDAAGVKNPSSEFLALRRAVERDRYGLIAYVLMTRDHCSPQSCAAFRSLADSRQVAGNMDDHVYENLITRYAASWNAPAQPGSAGAAGLMAGLPPSAPTGKPTNAEFPTSASTPAVSIMAPEPPLAAKPPATTAARAPAATPATSPAAAANPSPAPAAPKKQAAKRAPAAAPVPLAPAAQAPAPAAAPPEE